MIENKFYKITVDEKVWNHLKSFAEPFVDTPNSVLHRLLFPQPLAESVTSQNSRLTASAIDHEMHQELVNKASKNDLLIESLARLPQALSQTLEVVYEMKKLGHTRIEATKIVAARRGASPLTVVDKYTRQLNKKSKEIDALLNAPDLTTFKQLLLDKYPKYRTTIDEFFAML